MTKLRSRKPYHMRKIAQSLNNLFKPLSPEEQAFRKFQAETRRVYKGLFGTSMPYLSK